MGKSLKKQQEERNNALFKGQNLHIVSPNAMQQAPAKEEEPADQDQEARDLAEDEIKRRLEADDFDEKADLFDEIAQENYALQKTIKDLHDEAEMLAATRNEWKDRAEAEEKARIALAAQIAELSKEVSMMKEAKGEAPAQMEVIKPSAQPEKIKAKFSNTAEVIGNAQNLIKIGMRIEYLKEKKAQLDSFIFGSSQTGESMTMKDAGGQEFTSNNPMLLKKIKDMVLHDIKNAIEQAELQLFDLA